MKKILLTALAGLMITVTASAQMQGDLNFDIRVGGNLAKFTSYDGGKFKPGLYGGLGFDYFLMDDLALRLELNGEMLGTKDTGIDKKVELTYVGIPLQAKFYLTPWLAVHAGPQFSYLLSAKVGGEKTYEEAPVKDSFKSIEIAVPVGLTWEPALNDKGEALTVDLRYRYGFTHANKKGAFDNDIRNSAIILTIGFKTDILH